MSFSTCFTFIKNDGTFFTRNNKKKNKSTFSSFLSLCLLLLFSFSVRFFSFSFFLSLCLLLLFSLIVCFFSFSFFLSLSPSSLFFPVRFFSFSFSFSFSLF